MAEDIAVDLEAATRDKAKLKKYVSFELFLPLIWYES